MARASCDCECVPADDSHSRFRLGHLEFNSAVRESHLPAEMGSNTTQTYTHRCGNAQAQYCLETTCQPCSVKDLVSEASAFGRDFQPVETKFLGRCHFDRNAFSSLHPTAMRHIKRITPLRPFPNLPGSLKERQHWGRGQANKHEHRLHRLAQGLLGSRSTRISAFRCAVRLGRPREKVRRHHNKMRQ